MTQNAWMCFAQATFIIHACRAVQQDVDLKYAILPRMLDEAKQCNQEDPRRHGDGALTRDAQACGHIVEAAERGAVSRAVKRLDLG